MVLVVLGACYKTYLQATSYRKSRLYLGIYMYINIHICVWQQLMQKEVLNLKESTERYMGRFGERKEKGK